MLVKGATVVKTGSAVGHIRLRERYLIGQICKQFDIYNDKDLVDRVLLILVILTVNELRSSSLLGVQ